MKPKFIRILLSVGLMTTIYFLPDQSLQSAKRALELMVVANLGIEVFQKMRQG